MHQEVKPCEQAHLVVATMSGKTGHMDHREPTRNVKVRN